MKNISPTSQHELSNLSADRVESLDTQTFISELANTFNTFESASVLLSNVGFPAGSIPSFKNAELFWALVFEELHKGILPRDISNGIKELLAEAAKKYPGNRVFRGIPQALCTGYAPASSQIPRCTLDQVSHEHVLRAKRTATLPPASETQLLISTTERVLRYVALVTCFAVSSIAAVSVGALLLHRDNTPRYQNTHKSAPTKHEQHRAPDEPASKPSTPTMTQQIDEDDEWIEILPDAPATRRTKKRRQPPTRTTPQWYYTYNCLVGPDDPQQAADKLTNNKGICSASDARVFLPGVKTQTHFADELPDDLDSLFEEIQGERIVSVKGEEPLYVNKR